jgi:hypothetical protein
MASSLHEPSHLALSGCVRDLLVLACGLALVAVVLLAIAWLVSAA